MEDGGKGSACIFCKEGNNVFRDELRKGAKNESSVMESMQNTFLIIILKYQRISLNLFRCPSLALPYITPIRIGKSHRSVFPRRPSVMLGPLFHLPLHNLPIQV